MFVLLQKEHECCVFSCTGYFLMMLLHLDQSTLFVKIFFYNVCLLYYIVSAYNTLNALILQCMLTHPRIPRGDSARYINPWDN